MEKSRITALVDGIFAVAMTLLVLDLKLPEGIKMNTDAEVWRQLTALRGHFLIYALSFVVLGTYWVALGCAASIAISFYSPGIAVWLLLAVHFLVARRQRV